MLSPNPVLLDLEFGTVEIHKNCVISTIKEGVLFDVEERKQLYEVFDKYFNEEPFVYISNRKNDYTVNPTSYLQEDDYSNQLLGMAVICYSESSYHTALFEQKFYKRAFKVFYSTEACEIWAKNILFNRN